MIGKYLKTTYWNLVATGEVLAWAVFYADNFRKQNFIGRFLKTSLWPLSRMLYIAMDISLEYKKSKHSILELGDFW